jgi:hypothetical protein
MAVLDVVQHRDHDGGVEACILKRKPLCIGQNRLEALGGGARQHLARAVDHHRFPALSGECGGVVAVPPPMSASRRLGAAPSASRSGLSTDGLAERVSS